MQAEGLHPPAPGRRRTPGTDPAPRTGTGNNRRFDPLVNRARDLRNRVGKKRNVATSDYNVHVPGRGNARGSIDTVSGRGNQADRGFTDINRTGQDRLPNYSTGDNTHDRTNDSEKKIFEHFSREFPDRATSGNITIYTDRHPCEGCAQSTQDFLRRYPNMQVDIVYTNREGAGVPEPGVQNNFPGDRVNDRITLNHYTRGAP